MDKFRDKYRIPSARWQNWDYRWSGAYFITICTKQREPYFGTVENGNMQLSPAGIIADDLWYEIKNHTQNVELGEFVVMPNHIHGILVLNGNEINNDETRNGNVNTNQNDNGNDSNTDINMDTDTNININTDADIVTDIVTVETGHALSLQPTIQPIVQPTIGQQRFQNIGNNSVSSIIGSYKSAVTKHTHGLGIEFEWQQRFHDHVIRNDSEYQRISEYIIHNPEKWEDDKFFMNIE